MEWVIAAASVVIAGVGVALWWRWLAKRQQYWRVQLADAIPVNSAVWRARRTEDGDLLYVAVGDSAAQGIGASTPSRGYVGLVASAIEGMTGTTPRVANLASSGATLAIAIENQLPRLSHLEPDVLTVSIGANDIAGFDAGRFEREIAILLDALPKHAIVADLPSFYFLPAEKKVRVANRLLRAAAAERGLTVVPLHARTKRYGLWGVARQFAGDLFHPNDRGYRVWADAFLPAVSARLSER
ncbi:hypothetical protein BH10ACT7_BH10ACT7_11900 [soil metagenome]